MTINRSKENAVKQINESLRFERRLRSPRNKNELLTCSCRVGFFGHFDIIYVAVAQCVMIQFKMEVVGLL